jgi:hypothetical protein
LVTQVTAQKTSPAGYQNPFVSPFWRHICPNPCRKKPRFYDSLNAIARCFCTVIFFRSMRERRLYEYT